MVRIWLGDLIKISEDRRPSEDPLGIEDLKANI